MKKHPYFNSTIIIGIVVFTLSCGPSQQEIEQRQQIVTDSLELAKKRNMFVADSLNSVRQDSIKKLEENKEIERIHKEKIEVGKSLKKTLINNKLDKLKAQLIKAENRLNEINEFQIGRLTTTKNQQISDQKSVIYELQDVIKRFEKEISYTNLFESYEFQLSPKGTVEYIFSAAKNEDYSKLRNLVDPYGEFNDNALEICLVELLPKKNQKEWKILFENGRIMGESEINNDKIEIEIAIGNRSNRLEKVMLVKRMSRWYIHKF